ncbi:short chain dehydrogenase [Pseudomonas sp. SWRI153]|uniref:Short chain dehydrogenase n=1 Tax=Pseudomonas khorasanensis TaxID=2745508 RepID=A0A923F0N7_9PSED|nr:short chain dehydrogenase [Pseudomonas khorasanensis]MBV4484909.1 short chain dehydrogenase [Pseudomonas khorasanensis]
MIAPETGMKPGQRYRIESVERAPQFSGFFLGAKYYLGPELQTAVGWLEGQKFVYDQLDPTGEPVYPDRIAGTIEALTLVMQDGLRLEIEEAPYQAEPTPPVEPTRERRIERLSRLPIRPSPLLVAGAAMLVGVCLLAISRVRNR